MPVVRLSVQHGTTREQARERLTRAIAELAAKAGPILRGAEWSADRDAVKLSGPGVVVDLTVDDREVHLVGDVGGLGGLLGSPVLSGIKHVLEQTFHKRLT